jgi:hypothetical protein
MFRISEANNGAKPNRSWGSSNVSGVSRLAAHQITRCPLQSLTTNCVEKGSEG